MHSIGRTKNRHEHSANIPLFNNLFPKRIETETEKQVMFKKLRNAIPKGAGGRNSDGFRQKVQTLEQMGFSTVQAENALEASSGNLEQATNLLLSSPDVNGNSNSSIASSSPASATSAPDSSRQTEDEQLARAIQESLKTNNHTAAASSPSRAPTKSAAAIRAGQAAAARAENASSRFGANGKVLRKKTTRQTPAGSTKLSTTNTSSNVSTKNTKVNVNNTSANYSSETTAFLAQHPNVKVPKKLKDHSKLNQILRSTKRLAPEVLAVDTILNALLHIRDDPSNDKYRKIDRSSQGYTKALKDKPGAMDLLRAVNFHERSSNPSSDLILNRSDVDHALLYMGISALEEVRKGEEYLNAKRFKVFLREAQKIKDGTNFIQPEEEVVKRANFISKCPAEPSGGAGALVQVRIGGETISRRFDGDDILKDVLNWIGAHGSTIPDLIMTREWSLVDLHRYPVTEIDVEGDAEKTLQYIGCWPSGKLEIRPSTPKWKDDKVPCGEAGSSRGLGAVSS